MAPTGIVLLVAALFGVRCPMSKVILIVDASRSSGVQLRNSLASGEDTVHVVSSFAPALQLLQRKKIDTAVVEFSSDKATTNFCNAARELGVPVVYTSPPVGPFDLRQYGFEVAFPDLTGYPTMRVQYQQARA
jgi:hypothetical protein